MSALKTEQISLEQVNMILSELGQHVHNAFHTSNFQRAEQLLKRIIEIAPQQPFAWMRLAYAMFKQNNYQDAYDASHKAIEYMADQIHPDIYDNLVEICYQLGRFDEQVRYGKLAIQLKKNLNKDAPFKKIHPKNRPKFNPKNPQENIISYSLFGGLPRYCEVAVLNVELAKEIYPEWTCRFYVDDTVPKQVISRLKGLGAQTIYVTNQQKKLSGLFWRFFILDDMDVKYFLIRDADSLLSYRERAAVDEWLKSKKWFHKMHDAYAHSELILAGMWGGCHGIFKNIEQDISYYIEHHQGEDSRVIDQHYLRQHIWPTLKQTIFIHDSQGYENDAQPFPIPNQQKAFEHSARFHVGANEGASTVNMILGHAPAKEIRMYIKNHFNDETICFYDFIINHATEFSVLLPDHYGKKIQSKEWYIATWPINAPEMIEQP